MSDLASRLAVALGDANVQAFLRTIRASDAYAVTDTWGDFIRACGPHDDSAFSQDLFAVWCIYTRGALDDVLAGRLDIAISKFTAEPALKEPTMQSMPTEPLAIAASDTRLLGSPAFIVSMILLLFPLMLMVDFLFVHPESYLGDIRVQIVTAVLLIVSAVGGYWIGTSYSSARKTELAAGASPAGIY